MVEMEVRKVTKGVESNMVAFDFEHTPITQIADYIIITASNNAASDIHFDPREDSMMVRLRIDGDLHDYTSIPKIYEKNLTTRLKLLANMNITESRLPQDGAIKGEFGGKYLDMRVSCLPLNTGEKIVIRILDYSRSLEGLDTLGFNQTNLKKIKRMMAVPNGIILITGATGSGKSTTVYSMLQELNKPETNIITVEDPIEMNITGLNQVQVNAEIGMTFAAALRSILRQDPNVILIGEIRDSETAQIAVRASITGHLVLSTIHTNNSLSTIERLLDMDVERYLLSTALTGIVSQRLAKKLCTNCRIERETTKYEKKVFKKFMNRDIEKIYDANPKGCEKCRNGYKNRIAIHEVLELDDEIRNALANAKLKKEELSKMVYGDKTITMLQDALGKAISGLTSFEEVYRVIELESDPDDDTAYLTRTIEDVPEIDTDKATVEASESFDNNISMSSQIPSQVVGPLQNNPVQNSKVSNNAQNVTIQEVPQPTPINNNSNVPEQPVQATLPQVAVLTPEQEKVQAESLKQQLKRQKEKEAEKRITDQLATVQDSKKSVLVVNKPNINPVPVSVQAKTKTQPVPEPVTNSKASFSPNQHQLPKSTSDKSPQRKIEPPKMEKMEKAIPELNITTNVSSKDPVFTTMDGSPIAEDEHLFEEKDKVKEIDVNKISKSIDLKIEEKATDQPLIPTVKTKSNLKEASEPIIIETFAADDDMKKAPKLNEIKMNQIKKNITIEDEEKEKNTEKETTPSLNTTSPTAKALRTEVTEDSSKLQNKQQEETLKADNKTIIKSEEKDKQLETNKNFPTALSQKETVLPVISNNAKKTIETAKTTLSLEDAAKEIKSIKDTAIPKLNLEPKVEPNNQIKKAISKTTSIKTPSDKISSSLIKPTITTSVRLGSISNKATKATVKPIQEDVRLVIPTGNIKKNDVKKVDTLVDKVTSSPIPKQEPLKTVMPTENTNIVEPKNEVIPVDKVISSPIPKQEPLKTVMPTENTNKVEPKNEAIPVDKVVSSTISKQEPLKTVMPTENTNKVEPKNETIPVDKVVSSTDPKQEVFKVVMPTENTNKAELQKIEDLVNKSVLPVDSKQKSNEVAIPSAKNEKINLTKVEHYDEKKKSVSKPDVNIFELPTVKEEKNKVVSKKKEINEKKPFITEMKSDKDVNIFELPAVKDEKNKVVSKKKEINEKKPFITEMKSDKFEFSDSSKRKFSNKKVDNKSLSYITEMKTPKVNEAITKVEKTESKDEKSTDKKLFISEMKLSKKTDLGAKNEDKSGDKNKEDTDNKSITAKKEKTTEKKPFITEMKTTNPKASTNKSTDKKLENKDINDKKDKVTVVTNKPKVNIFDSPATDSLEKNKKSTKKEIISEDLDLNIDGELTVLGED